MVIKLPATARETRAEAAAISAWGHTQAAVQLIDTDFTHAALLLERIRPGTHLPGNGDAASIEIAADLLIDAIAVLMSLDRRRARRWAAIWAVLQTCQAWRDDQSDPDACMSASEFENLLNWS